MTTRTKWTPANIRCLRVCGLLVSQAEMVAYMGVNPNAIHKWESGLHHPRPKGIRLLEQAAESSGWKPGEGCRALCGGVMPDKSRKCQGHPLCDGRYIYC